MSEQEQAGAGQTTRVQDVHFNLFKGLYLNREKFTAAACYQCVKAIAEKNGEEIPGIDSFLRRLKREVSPVVIDLARDGMHVVDDDHVMRAVEGPGRTIPVDDGLYTIFRDLYLCGNGYSADFCYSRLNTYLEDGEELPEIGAFIDRLYEETGAEVRRNAAFAEE